MTEDLSPAISLATLLRENGIRTQLHCEEKKFKQKISYADKLGIPYVIFLGEDEINAGVVACKDMATASRPSWTPPPRSTASRRAWRSGRRHCHCGITPAPPETADAGWRRLI